MNARLLVNFALLMLLVALGWFAFSLDARRAAPPSTALTSLPVDRIESIRIERSGQTVARLRRSGGIWRVQEPFVAAADAFRVQAFLGLVSAHSHVSFRAADNDLTQYGLQAPRATLRFNDTVLHVGEADPVAGHRYVMSGDRVHLLEDNWFSQIFGDGTAWIDARPLPADATPRRIELRAGPRPGAQWQQIDGRWQRTPADPTPGAQSSEQRGAALAAAWVQARALSVQRREPALEWSGQVKVTLEAPPSSTIVFAVALTNDAMFLARDDLGVQYRFLLRQGKALLDAITPP